MRRAALTLVVLAAVGGSVYAYYAYRRAPSAPTVTTVTVSRGDIADTVGATGTLQAVTTVQVGSQVSGTIEALNADFNSLVRKGQVLARLDPSLFQTQIDQASANLVRAQADLDRLKVTLDDARTKLVRARDLSAKQLISQTDMDVAEVLVRSTEAQIRSSQASVTQAEAALNQNKVNLQHTVITAPIDGLVISRNVDVGQTVAASMNAPVLFILAADLTKMQVVANLDESDVGRIRPGQPATFRVDAYPAEDFRGNVAQVRLQPIVQQNVVTYATVIDVPNPELKLKPGMTATVSVEIARRSNVLRIPNTALRFRPTNEMFAALGQPPPSAGLRAQAGTDGPSNGDVSRGRGQGAVAQSPTVAGGAPTVEGGGPAAGGGAGRGNGRGGQEAALRMPPTEDERPPVTEDTGPARPGGNGRGAGGGRVRARGAAGLAPEAGEALAQRLGGRGAGRGTEAAGTGQAAGAGGPAADDATTALRKPAATTFDALFGPLPAVESLGQVWQHVDGQLKAIRVRLGISDGQATELIEGDVQEQAELVSNVTTGAETRPTPTGPAGFSPFTGPQRGGFQGGGGGFGGGGGRGR